VAGIQQGTGRLADALSRVAQPTASSRHGCRVIVGKPFRVELECAVAARSGSHVLFAGRIGDRDLPRVKPRRSSCTRRYEGSSLVTLEAMAHRKAVIATMAGGLPDKVRPGLNGWLVEPDDPAALAGAIEDALSDPLRLLAFGAKSRQIVESEFAWSVLVERYLELYDQLLSTHR
jgi:glycosyltransferase involved in cell wall biosynthesis